MSEFVEIAKKLRAICNVEDCKSCPIGTAKGKWDTCFEFLCEHPDKVEKIVKGAFDERD